MSKVMPTLKSKYIVAVDCCSPTIYGPAYNGPKTHRWEIRSKSQGSILGWVRWYGPWRQYCFFPCEGTIYNNGCLESITQFLYDANLEHKAKVPHG